MLYIRLYAAIVCEDMIIIPVDWQKALAKLINALMYTTDIKVNIDPYVMHKPELAARHHNSTQLTHSKSFLDA